MIKAIAQNYAQTKGPTKKFDKINYEVHGPRSVFHLSTLIGVLRKCSQFGGQVCQNLRFLEFLKKRKMADFKSKILCDENSKIKNLRWQLSCIFRRLRRGVLRFFSRRCFHGDICRSKSPNLQISKKDEKLAFSYGKIRPLEMIFFLFFPTIFLARLRGTFWTPERWSGTQNEDFHQWSPSNQKWSLLSQLSKWTIAYQQLYRNWAIGKISIFALKKTLNFFFLTWWHLICLK